MIMITGSVLICMCTQFHILRTSRLKPAVAHPDEVPPTLLQVIKLESYKLQLQARPSYKLQATLTPALKAYMPHSTAHTQAPL